MNHCLIVGEAPSAGCAGLEAFDPHGPSGARLAELAGVSDVRNVARTANLFDRPVTRWDRIAAIMSASVIRRGTSDDERLVLCGARVVAAFRLSDVYGPGINWLTWHRHSARLMAAFPHPSRRNRWWNEPGNVTAARAFLLSAIDDHAWTPA